MKTDLLASRHIGINEQDTAIMLRKLAWTHWTNWLIRQFPPIYGWKSRLHWLVHWRNTNLENTSLNWQLKTNYIPHISVWDGTTRSLRPLSSGMYSKTQYGILLTLRTRQRYRKDVWKHWWISRQPYVILLPCHSPTAHFWTKQLPPPKP